MSENGGPPSPVTLAHSDEKTGAAAQTRKINPRAEIDTSPPFSSVEEAVTHFGGRGSWIPPHLMYRSGSNQDSDEFDMAKVERQAAELEKDLIVKERETLEVLKNLEAAKRIVKELKLNLMTEVTAFMDSPYLGWGAQMLSPNANSDCSLTSRPTPSPGLISMELNQAKVNLNKTTIDLSVIRASIDSLNMKMRKGTILSEKTSEKQMPNAIGVLSVGDDHRARLKPKGTTNAETMDRPENYTSNAKELQQLSFESDQFKYMAEAARYEVMKAMSEIEHTKTCINIAEMRLVAAKRMEEAARAVEAIAFAERQSNGKFQLDGFLQKQDGTTLSHKEYSVLAQKAEQAEELPSNKFVDASIHETNLPKVDVMKDLGNKNEVKYCKKSLQEALGQVDGRRNRRKFSADESINNGRSEQGQIRDSSKYKLRNSHPSQRDLDSHMHDGNELNLLKDKSMPALRSTFSIGNILSRKLILRDDIMVGKHVENHGEGEQVSLSQMLREQSGLILCPSEGGKDAGVNRQFFAQKKKFGFIHVSFPLAKQSKKKAHAGYES